MRRSFAQASRVTRSSPSRCACSRRNSVGFRSATSWRTTRRPSPSRIALPWPENAERSRPGLRSVSVRPRPAVIGIGPSRGRCATSPTAVMPLQPASRSSAHAGTSWRTSTSGRSALASRTISSRYTDGPGGEVLPWKRFQLRISTVCRLLYERRARRPRRPSRVHAAVRPRARGGARPRRRGGRARHLALPLRRGARAGRIPPPRGLLPALVAAVPALPAATAAEGGRAPDRPGAAGAHPHGTSSTSSGWPRRSSTPLLFRTRGPAVFTAHDLLPRRTAHREDLWRRLLAQLRPDRRPQRARPRGAGRARRRPRAAAGDPARRVPERPRPHGRRSHGALPRGDPPVQGARATRSRRSPGWTARGCSSPAIRSSRSTGTAPPPATGPSGGSATCVRRSSTGRSATRRSPSSPTGRSSTSPGRSCGPSAPACRRSSTTSAGWPSRCAPTARAGSCPAGDVDALAEAIRGLLGDAAELETARAGARRARDELTWDRAAAAHLDLYRELLAD